MGTCAMKPRELGGVVDSKLNVYGLKGLKLTGEMIYPWYTRFGLSLTPSLRPFDRTLERWRCE